MVEVVAPRLALVYGEQISQKARVEQLAASPREDVGNIAIGETHLGSTPLASLALLLPRRTGRVGGRALGRRLPRGTRRRGRSLRGGREAVRLVDVKRER